tara:strand:- start:200 stop:511 length:312 start_codon:yes stop_codon:yes gene_type:complete
MGIDFGSAILVLLVLGLVCIGLFFLFRELLMWYWKINERIALQYKTNLLLEKISLLLSDSGDDTITIEEISTGKTKSVSVDEWVLFLKENPKVKGYKMVKREK